MQQERTCFVGQIEENMLDKGLRLTWRRQAIIDVFRAADGRHLSADDVLQSLKARKIAANATTVYRNLELMAREEILRHVDFHDGVCRYELGGSPDHHHLHCTKCGKLLEFDCNNLVELANILVKETGFKIERHQLEVYGICPACR
jgi:Fur family transcriptional regulator, ferric uptake regulator